VLDDVERRRVLEQPAGKHLVPRQRLIRGGALLHENLDEGTHFRRIFPRQAALTIRQPNDDISDPACFAGLHHQVLGNVVALVEQAERCHPVLDRGAILTFDDLRSRSSHRDVRRHLGRSRLDRLVGLLATAGKRHRGGS
jgi:hypothetical protein